MGELNPQSLGIESLNKVMPWDLLFMPDIFEEFLNYPLFFPKILCSGARKRDVSWNGTNLHDESIHPQYVTLMTHLPPVMHLLEIAIITSISFQRRYVASAHRHLVGKGAVCHFDGEKKCWYHSWYPNRMTTSWYCKPVEKKKFPCICATPSCRSPPATIEYSARSMHCRCLGEERVAMASPTKPEQMYRLNYLTSY